MILGLDLGGTQLRGATVDGKTVSEIRSVYIDAEQSGEKVLQQVFDFTDALFTSSVKAIGIGVPGLVDPDTGVVFDVVNIPAWKEIDLQKRLFEYFQVPVAVNNDANCFALGEYFFGKGQGADSMIGLTIGTGLGSGLILNKKLYTGVSGGAGEFGMMDYMDHTYEYYASGQFFHNVYEVSGQKVFEDAHSGSPEALRMYSEMGFHLGNAIRAILLAIDTELIVLGGSVSRAYHFFSKTMWEQVNQFPYRRLLKKLRIEVSELENSGVLGAAALHL